MRRTLHDMNARVLQIAALLSSLALAACGSDSASSGSGGTSASGGSSGSGASGGSGGSSASGGSGGGSSCDAKTLTCGQVVSTADLTAILGAAPTTYDESGHPNCNIGSSSGGGGVQVFCGADYDSLLSGAKASYPATNETNTIGTKSFEIESTNLAEVGLVTTGGKYAVLVNLINGDADITKARVLAKKVDDNLSAL